MGTCDRVAIPWGISVVAAAQTTASGTPKIDVQTCEHLVNTASQRCGATPAMPPEPGWDALANSFAALGAAIAWAGLVLGVVALLGAVSWGTIVWISARREAEKIAKEHVNEVAPGILIKWLDENAPRILREFHDMKQSEAATGGTATTFNPTELAEHVDENAQR